jgi:type I restriction enzyme S subunit
LDMSFEGWKTVKLQDIVTKLGDGLHGTPRYDDKGEYYFINGNNLVDGKIVIKESTKKVNEKEYLKYHKDLNDRTILLGINGTIGNVAIYNREKCILGKSACYFNVIPDVSKDYIKYVVIGQAFQNYIQNFASGTTIKNVSLKLVREFEFKLPPSSVQQKVASILSSLDNKIELNRQTNQTLEAIAQALFKEWFVDFNFPGATGEMQDSELGKIPRGWKVGKLFDISKLIGGGTPKTSINEYWNDANIDWISARDVTPNNGSFIISTEKKITALGLQKSSAKLLPKHSTIITARGTVGNYCIIPREMAISQSNYALTPAIPNATYFLFLIVANLITELKQRSYGTVFDTITTNSLSDIKIIIPGKETLEKFHQIVSSLYNCTLNNLLQNQILVQLRDTLLPKLMKGEISIAQTEKLSAAI